MRFIGWLYWQYIRILRRRYRRLQAQQQAVAKGRGWCDEFAGVR
jgi:hypothetical protein